MGRQLLGVSIESGLSDWQIIQQDAGGLGTVQLRGRWAEQPDVPHTGWFVQVRVADMASGVSISAELDWQRAQTHDDHTWSASLRVPAGGLYRLETRLNASSAQLDEWSVRGDMRHFWGVGDLWVIAGQSNSAGYGRGPVHDPPEMGVHLFRNSETWMLAAHPFNDSTDTRHIANRETANPGHSPYLHTARLLKKELGYPIGLVQTALGGSALALWNPSAGEQAVLFRNMMHCVKQAGGKVRGVLWYQGEHEAGNEQWCRTYAEDFAAAVKGWREALGNAELPVITVQLNRAYQPWPAELARQWTVVRDAQRRVPKMLPQVSVVPSLDLPLGDLIHTSAAGNMLLGERVARAALGMVYGRKVAHLAPDVREARWIDSRQIELRFDHVTSRMDNVDVTANPFLVEDEKGPVAVEQVVYPKNHTIRLVLAREAVGQTVVHGAWGYDPKVAPTDIERLMPMLGFYGLTVR